MDTDIDDRLTDDTIYSILTNPRRRYVLHHLKQSDGPISVRELAEQVAAWENDKKIEKLSSQERKRVYVSLYQSHLSTLDDEGVIEYDKESSKVKLSPAARESKIYMELVPENNIPWRSFYIGLVIINSFVIALVLFEIRPFTLVPDIGWAIAILIQFSLSAVAETISSRRMRFGDEGPPPDRDSN